MKLKKKIPSVALTILAALFVPMALTSCDEDPLEEAGENLEEAGEEIGEGIEELGK